MLESGGKRVASPSMAAPFTSMPGRNASSCAALKCLHATAGSATSGYDQCDEDYDDHRENARQIKTLKLPHEQREPIRKASDQ